MEAEKEEKYKMFFLKLFNRIKQKMYNAYKYCCIFLTDF